MTAHARSQGSDAVAARRTTPLPAPIPSSLDNLRSRRRADVEPVSSPNRSRRRGLVFSLGLLVFGAPIAAAAIGTSSSFQATSPRTAEVPSIASNVDVKQFIASGYNGGNKPSSVAWEGVWGTGNFRSICKASHFLADDPIVAPGKPGATHLHMFFGNTAANASSNYASLRTSGDSTCHGRAINRSAYWVPALFDANGTAQIPDHIALYYKSADRDPLAVQSLPPGLRMIAGYDMNNPNAADHHDWLCDAPGAQSGKTIPNCPGGQTLVGRLVFPSCWNGRDLDSADHRSHMAYAVRDARGRNVCPTTHPVLLPEVAYTMMFKHSAPTAGWYVSSDRMAGMTHANGSTLHGDWYGAWDPAVMDAWRVTCINGKLDCQNGQLGNDTSLVAGVNYSGTPPRDGGPLVTMPPTTATPTTAAPTTAAPTTQAPATTAAPTTIAPISSIVAPTTGGTAPSPAVGPQSQATWQPLSVGSTGEYVRRAQSTLQQKGHAVKVTSVFDDRTAAALLAEQQKWSGLADTGTVDWSTGVHLGIFWSADRWVTPAPTTTAPSMITPTTQAPATTAAPTTQAPTTQPPTTAPATTTPATTTPATLPGGAPSAPGPSPAVQKWTSTNWPGMWVGSTGEYVRRAQRALFKIGYRDVADTGVFDQVTADAVLREQQRWSGLADTGQIDWATGMHLGLFW